MICPECGKEVENDVEFCYFCGADFLDNINSIEDTKEMKCPICNGWMQKGTIEAINPRSLLNMDTFVRFYTEEENGKLIKKNATSLSIKAEGYYCSRCCKYIGIFNQR